MSKPFAIVAVLLALALPAPAEKIYEVGPGKAYATVQAALDQIDTELGGGSFPEPYTVLVYADTYVANFAFKATLNASPANPITVKAASETNPPVFSGVTFGYYQNSHDSIVDGLVFTNGGGGSIYMKGITRHTIQNCRFYGFTTDKIVYIDGNYFASPYINFYGNLFMNCTGTIIRQLKSSYVNIHRNIFINCGLPLSAGVNAKFGSVWNNIIVRSGPFAWEATATDSKALNNSFYVSNSVALSMAGPQIAQNNIFYVDGAAAKGVSIILNKTASSDYNCFWTTNGAVTGYLDPTPYATLADWQVGSGRDALSIEKNPLFVDVPNNDLRIWYTSPCRDAGQNLAFQGFTDDFEGDIRPFFGGWDIGADECETNRKPRQPPHGSVVSVE